MAQSDMQQLLQSVLKAEPELTPYGFDPYGSRLSLAAVKGESLNEYKARIAEARSKFDLAQFADALSFCKSRLVPIKTINTRRSSYGLKHIVERACHTYITNGTLIAAALAAGFTHKRFDDGPNCAFNISERSLKDLPPSI